MQHLESRSRSAFLVPDPVLVLCRHDAVLASLGCGFVGVYFHPEACFPCTKDVQQQFEGRGVEGLQLLSWL